MIKNTLFEHNSIQGVEKNSEQQRILNIKVDDLPSSIHDYYYIIIIGIYFLAMFIAEMRVGLAASAIILILTISHLKKHSIVFRSSTDWFVALYIVYNAGSVIWFSLSGFPLSVFIREYSNTVLPVFFYFFASQATGSKSKFYENTLRAIIFNFVVGFILYIQMPYFYRLYLYTNFGIGTNIILSSQYFNSLIGITLTGSLGVVGALLSYKKIIKSQGRKGTTELIICIVALVLTLRRGALYSGIIAIAGIHYLSYFKYKLIKYRFLLFEIILIAGIVLWVSKEYPDIFPMLLERISMFTEAFLERNDSWLDGMNNASNLIIGDGLGIYGHKVIGYSTNYIADGYYFRMLAEIGVIGMFLFLGIIITSLLKGFRNLRVYYLETSVICVLLLQAVGSDTLSFQLIAPIFWYSIGRCQNRISLRN